MNADKLKDMVEWQAKMMKEQADRIVELDKELQSAEVDISVYRTEIAVLKKIRGEE